MQGTGPGPADAAGLKSDRVGQYVELNAADLAGLLPCRTNGNPLIICAREGEAFPVWDRRLWLAATDWRSDVGTTPRSRRISPANGDLFYWAIITPVPGTKLTLAVHCGWQDNAQNLIDWQGDCVKTDTDDPRGSYTYTGASCAGADGSKPAQIRVE